MVPMSQEPCKLWADGVATAEEIELVVRATMSFRMTQKGPLKRSEMAGVWRWPKDFRVATRLAMLNSTPCAPEQPEKIRKHWTEGKPRFVDPGNIWASYEPAYRYFAPRLKEDYWLKEKELK
jgi:hypothetical protein